MDKLEFLTEAYPYVPLDIMIMIINQSENDEIMHNTLEQIYDDQSLLDRYRIELNAISKDPEVSSYLEAIIDNLLESNFKFDITEVSCIIFNFWPDKLKIKEEIKAKLIQRQKKPVIVHNRITVASESKVAHVHNVNIYTAPISYKDHVTVDYHGYKLTDALHDVERRLKHAKIHKKNIIFNFITGKGNHSPQGYSVILKNLITYFEDESIKWQFNAENNGALVATKQFL